ncbi:unnamed protein product [Lymnaea stagnalis]|uniref:Uncharacterized protein n=1 Tax=Lymnaea stagnalis TaxID=6523 RepID=A0AAV2HF23_LYMST
MAAACQDSMAAIILVDIFTPTVQQTVCKSPNQGTPPPTHTHPLLPPLSGIIMNDDQLLNMLSIFVRCHELLDMSKFMYVIMPVTICMNFDIGAILYSELC